MTQLVNHHVGKYTSSSEAGKLVASGSANVGNATSVVVMFNGDVRGLVLTPGNKTNAGFVLNVGKGFVDFGDVGWAETSVEFVRYCAVRPELTGVNAGRSG